MFQIIQCANNIRFYKSQGQYIFCVNHNKSDIQNLELLRAIENCLTCQVWHACLKFPTSDLGYP